MRNCKRQKASRSKPATSFDRGRSCNAMFTTRLGVSEDRNRGIWCIPLSTLNVVQRLAVLRYSLPEDLYKVWANKWVPCVLGSFFRIASPSLHITTSNFANLKARSCGHQAPKGCTTTVFSGLGNGSYVKCLYKLLVVLAFR